MSNGPGCASTAPRPTAHLGQQGGLVDQEGLRHRGGDLWAGDQAREEGRRTRGGPRQTGRSTRRQGGSCGLMERRRKCGLREECVDEIVRACGRSYEATAGAGSASRSRASMHAKKFQHRS